MTKGLAAVMISIIVSQASVVMAGIGVTGETFPMATDTWWANGGAAGAETSVGYGGGGAVLLDGGSVLSTGLVEVGTGSGSPGSVTVDGAGSMWTCDFDFRVGTYGEGSLAITGGGKLQTDRYGAIAFRASGTGIATVTGSGSTWVTGQGMDVGWLGHGTLVVKDGGTVVAPYVYMAVNNDSTGVVVVDGAGSVWNTGTVWVGTNHSGYDTGGTGTVTITNGGLMRASNLSMDAGGVGDDSIRMASGGMLSLRGRADASLANFYTLITGSPAIRYWDETASQWVMLTEATYGEDYTLTYIDDGDWADRTVLTVTIPEPATLSLLALGGLAVIRRRRGGHAGSA